MKNVSSLIFLWFSFLSILPIISPITIPLVDLFWGLALMWVAFLSFYFGCHFKTNFERKSKPDSLSLLSLNLPISVISIGAIAASFYAVKVYTGKTPIEVVFSLILQVSLYNEYQSYFASQDLSVFSVKKIPAILSMLYLKLSLIYVFVNVIINNRYKLSKIFWLLVVVFAQSYFSIARGTSFELFEMLLILLFCIFIRENLYKKSFEIFKKQNMVFVGVLILVSIIYSWNISARYSFNEIASCSTADLCLDNQAFLYQNFPGFGEFLYKISGYFTFGIFYTSRFINEVVLQNLGSLLSLFWPFGSVYHPELKPDLLCQYSVDCGASWVPDVVSYIIHIGIFGLIVITFILGHFSRKLLERIFIQPSFFEITALYFIFLAGVSLPVGNFIVSSSANILSFMAVISYLVINTLFNFYKQFMSNVN